MNPAIRTKLRRLFILCGIALLIFIFGLSSSGVEYIYSSGLYQLTSVLQRFISSALPFSLGDLLYFLLIVYCLWSVYKAVKKWDKNSKFSVPVQLVSFLLILYIVFKLLWGLNYSRPSITGRLAISDKKYTTKELVILGEFLIRRVNTIEHKLQVSHSKKQYTIRELESKSKNAYDKLAEINSFFRYRVPAVKPVVFDWLISTIGIEGYYSPPSGEANVNMRIPAINLPFITCHEISHELGVAREDEANLAGYLTSINSDDLNFQYSGYYNILRNVLFEIRIKSPEDFAVLYQQINAGTLKDFRTEQEFWKQYNGDMSAYMGVALDKFLKINNQKKGTDSYQDIVLWVFNLHQSELKTGAEKKSLTRSPLIPPAFQN